jgi:signal transduction histidine kinase
MRAELEVSLRHDAMGPAARAGVERARAEVLRMGRIVENLLTLARVDEGGLELLRGPQDLLEIAHRATAARAATARAAGVEMVVEGEPITVVADRDRLDQVVANLLDNALRFAVGQVRVTVQGNAGEGRLVVADDGPGVPPEVRERVFDRFWRADAARDRSAGGVGLGLAICAEIVRAHGGRIWVEDRAEPGSAFVVELPAAEAGVEPSPGGRSERENGHANVRSPA